MLQTETMSPFSSSSEELVQQKLFTLILVFLSIDK